jgi:uncharacterized membrane protein YecN with MAPEG domain
MPILALYAGLLALIFIYLSFNIAMSRKKLLIGVGTGDGENKAFECAIRVQANFAEYVPIALILMAIFESNHGHYMVAHIAGITLVVARLLHAYGLGKSSGTSVGRFVGILLTWLVIVGLSVANIYYFILVTTSL